MDINAVNPLTESAELARTHKHTHTQLVETHARVYRRGRKLCAGMGGFADACMDGCADACMDVRMRVWMDAAPPLCPAVPVNVATSIDKDLLFTLLKSIQTDEQAETGLQLYSFN
eukprot:GHVU01154738.1.p1 GENE.GHVU01154738.1~~GHVU01154738.1.p1  ORF type:complete len:115 (-),score=8.13 GHVU01154738.1:437-781(-)